MLRPVFLIAFTAATLLLPGCALRLSGHGDVSERGGVLFVDDVALSHRRDVTLNGTAEFQELRLSTYTGNIDVRGVEGSDYALVLELCSESADDGRVEVRDGSIVARSESGGRLVVAAIRGTVPAGLDLYAHSGTGRIILRGFNGSDSQLDVRSGTGPIMLEQCKPRAIDVSSGTGALRLESCTSETIAIHSGTGSVVASGCRFGQVFGDSGTGNFSFRDSQVDTLSVRSGTGNLLLSNSVAGKLLSSLGTGDVLTDLGSNP